MVTTWPRRLALMAAGLLLVTGCASAAGQPAAPQGSATAVDPGTSVALDRADGLSADEVRVESALATAFDDPLSGGKCRSLRDARRAASRVLTELGMSDWTITDDRYARDDGCATASVRSDGQIDITTMYRPEVRDALEVFRELSLGECLEAEAATQMLTEALEEIGHRDFIVQQKAYVAGPNGREEEILAHAAAGCVFYTLSGAEEDGTLIYHLSGG